MIDPSNPTRHLRTQELKAYKESLFEKQGGICHWCHCQMIFRETCPPGENVGNVATFEHLEDSFSLNGRNSNPGTIVLSCSICNGRRNKEQEARVIAALKKHFGDDHHKMRRKQSIQETIRMLRSMGIEPLE